MSKHTKGPWNIMTTPSGYRFIEHWPTGTRVDDRIHVAEVEIREDAHLIAAAPDMYEALKMLISGFDESIYVDKELQKRKAKGIVLGIEALAKTEGRDK